MINLSDSAKKCLDKYIQQVRTYLRGCKTVDADEVERNVIEHIESEFEGATTAVSFKELDVVLQRLGNPRQWVPEEELSWWRKIILRLRADPEDMHQIFPSFKDTWLGWEKLRIYYNVVLLVEGLIGLWLLRDLGEKVGYRCVYIYGSQVWGMIIIYAALANVFYCLGPLAETSLVALRIRWTRRARHLLFTAGLLSSMLIILGLTIRGYAHISGYLR